MTEYDEIDCLVDCELNTFKENLSESTIDYLNCLNKCRNYHKIDINLN